MFKDFKALGQASLHEDCHGQSNCLVTDTTSELATLGKLIDYLKREGCDPANTKVVHFLTHSRMFEAYQQSDVSTTPINALSLLE